MSKKENTEAFFSGIPIEPDMVKLRNAFPESKMKTGDMIAYSQIGEVINAEYGTNRFRSVTNRWRREVTRETNIILGPEPKKGFVVLSESKKVDLSGSKLRSAARAATQSYMVAARVNIHELSEKEKVRYDHLVNTSSKILAAAQIKRRTALPSLKG